MTRLAAICLGGALGSGARYLVAGFIQQRASVTFPLGTLAVNVIGTFALSAIMFVGLSSEIISPTVRLALTTGVMGGFTTYSTFGYETMKAMQEGSYGVAALNVSVTVVACLVAAFAGHMTGRLVLGQ